MITLEFQDCKAVLLYGTCGTYLPGASVTPYIPTAQPGTYLPYPPGIPTDPGGRGAPSYMCNKCNIICLTRAIPPSMLIFMKAYLNASEIAKLLRVDRATVSRWVKRGVIQGAIRPTNTRQWRIPLETYHKLIKNDKI
jgi:excisionase family DNA binding protein